MAGRPFPEAEEYEGFVQHENGIGMARMFEAEVLGALRGIPVRDSDDVPHRGGFFAWVDGAPAEGYRSPRRSGAVGLGLGDRDEECSQDHFAQDEVALLTGGYGARVLEPLLPRLSQATGVPVRALPVPNRLFGGNIAVTGLMTGADVAAVLDSEPTGGRVRYLLPDVALSRGVFLDGSAPETLPRTVEVVATDGKALVDALRVRAG
jgi:NifB/MoaA-like Fe-S oxidoreductase